LSFPMPEGMVVLDGRAVPAGEAVFPVADYGVQSGVGVFEIMEVSESLRERIIHSAPISELRAQAIQEGMSTLRLSGLMKVRDGVTTLDEIVRETM